MEHDGLAITKIGSNAAEGRGQIVETGDGGIGKGHAVEHQAHAVTGIESVGTVEAVLEAEFAAELIVAAVLFAAIGKLPVCGFGEQRVVPVNGFDELAHLDAVASGGKGSADQSSHAGAGKFVDGDVVFFHPLQDADVGQAERAAAGESHADDGTVSGSGLRGSLACLSRRSWCGFLLSRGNCCAEHGGKENRCDRNVAGVRRKHRRS